MSGAVTALAFLSALAAAIRSTWSPCALSMLSSITAMSERSRGHRFAVTASWFVVGSVLGGATLGAASAILAAAVGAIGPPSDAVGLLVAIVAIVAALSDADLGPVRFPILRRQVNERWLDQLRGWTYGVGFGWQIGVGFATYVMTAAVVLMVLLAVLTGNPLVALGVGTCFGALRGMVVLLGGRVDTPGALRAFHRRLDALEMPVRAGCVAVEAAIAGAALALAGVAVPLAAGAAAAGLAVVVALRRLSPAA